MIFNIWLFVLLNFNIHVFSFSGCSSCKYDLIFFVVCVCLETCPAIPILEFIFLFIFYTKGCLFILFYFFIIVFLFFILTIFYFLQMFEQMTHFPRLKS